MRTSNEANVFTAVGSRPMSRRAEAITIGFLALLFVVLATTSVATKSPTVDEPLHLFAGYSYLKWADYWVNPEHPPFVKILAALPLLALDIKDSRGSNTLHRPMPQSDTGDPQAVAVAQKMLFVDNDADTLFFYARLPIIGLALLLGFFVYLWSRDLFGPQAAIASALFYALDPNILAHSSAIQTDLPFAAFFFIGTYYYWRTLNRPAWNHFLLTALSFGLAAVTKHSFPMVFLIWGVIGLLWVLSSKPYEGRGDSTDTAFTSWSKSGLVLVTLLASLIAAYSVIWAAYGFRFHAPPGVGQPLQAEQLMTDGSYLQALVHILNHYRIFPEAWTAGQLFALQRLSRVSYLFGEISTQGFWLYFPIVFAVKTPVPTLILSLVVLVRSFFEQKSIGRVFFVVPVILFFALGAWSRLNIGMRHILAVYPFLFVLIGGAAAELWRDKDRWKSGGLILLVAYYLVSSFSIYPHYFAFFNELVGGAKNGHRVLLDSNLDWGQDLKGLKRWMDANGISKLDLLYFGKADPQYYEIDAFYLPGSWVIRDSANNDLPAYLAVSANFLYGGRLFLTKAELDFLQLFQLGEPVTDIGHSILVFKVRQDDPHIHNNVGLVLARRGHLHAAAELFRRALVIQPEFAEAHQNLARVLRLQGNRSEAIYHYEEALRIMKTRPQALVTP